MLVSKMYPLVSVKYQLEIMKVDIWVNRYLTDITDTQPIQPIFYKTDFQYR